MDTADLKKDLIEALVKDYMSKYPGEFEDFKRGMRMKRGNLVNDFAEVREADYLERAIHEMPEALYVAFKFRLPDETFAWFRTKDGSRWFARRYPVFASGTKV